MKFLSIILFFLLLTITPAYAATNLTPRLTATGYMGTDTTGTVDAMIPLIANGDEFLYTDLQAKTGNDHAWMGSAGIGYRQVTTNADILGGYVFLDRDVTACQNTFWVLNLGLESLGKCWDIRANGYLPVSHKRAFDHTAWADEMGIGQYVVFKGHQQFDRLINIYEEIGAGADGEMGYTLPILHRAAIYGGGYFYYTKDTSNIKGVSARMEIPVNRYLTLMAGDTYDNHQHNTFAAGLRFSLGGTCTPTTPSPCYDIHDRLLAPVSRQLGTLHTGSGIPSVKVRKLGGLFLERDNIWFFKDKGSSSQANSGNGTFENPFSGDEFTQKKVNEIGDHSNFYFTPGAYALKGRLTLNQGQSMFGRTANFVLPAQNESRAVFRGGLVLRGNNILDSIQLFNDGSIKPQPEKPFLPPPRTAGIIIDNADHILINNSVIGKLDSSNGYQCGIHINQANDVKINRSQVNAFCERSFTLTCGISMNKSQCDIDNSEINSVSHVTEITALPQSYSEGIHMDGEGGVLHCNNTVINTTGSSEALTSINGLCIEKGVVFLDHCTLNTQSSATTDIAQTEGFCINFYGELLKLSHCTLNTQVNSQGSEQAGILAMGIYSNGRRVDIDDSIINVNATKAFGPEGTLSFCSGIEVRDGNLNITNSHINLNFETEGGVNQLNRASGILARNNSTVNIKNSSINAFCSMQGEPDENAAISGIQAEDSLINVDNSIINSEIRVNGESPDSKVTANGIKADRSKINLTNSEVTASAFSINGNVEANIIDVHNSSISYFHNTLYGKASAPQGKAVAREIHKKGSNVVKKGDNKVILEP